MNNASADYTYKDVENRRKIKRSMLDKPKPALKSKNAVYVCLMGKTECTINIGESTLKKKNNIYSFLCSY